MNKSHTQPFKRIKTPSNTIFDSKKTIRKERNKHKYKKIINSITSSVSTSYSIEQEQEFYIVPGTYLSSSQAKYHGLLIIQDLIRKCCYDAHAYCLMLQLINSINFEGIPQNCITVSITVFHLAAKYFYAFQRPLLSTLLYWTMNRVSSDEIIECQSKICKSLNFLIPTHQDFNEEQIVCLCQYYEQIIYCSQN